MGRGSVSNTVTKSSSSMFLHRWSSKRSRATKRKRNQAGATIAALMGDKSQDELIDAAVRRFRSISWTTLRERADIILDSQALDGNTCETEFYRLSDPCELANCDGFVSHSWHDCPTQKWRVLSEWCEEFQATHQRDPLLWLDKVCVNQSNIITDLECLPI